MYGLISCALKLDSCRVDCRKITLLSGACFEKCEGKYGALSNCKDEPEKISEDGQCADKPPEPDSLTPECTFAKWEAGLCGKSD